MQDYLAQLDRVLAEPVGLAFRCKDADALRRLFYVARKVARDSGETKYEVLMFSISPADKNILYVYKKDWRAVENEVLDLDLDLEEYSDARKEE